MRIETLKLKRDWYSPFPSLFESTLEEGGGELPSSASLDREHFFLTDWRTVLAEIRCFFPRDAHVVPRSEFVEITSVPAASASRSESREPSGSAVDSFRAILAALLGISDCRNTSREARDNRSRLSCYQREYRVVLLSHLQLFPDGRKTDAEKDARRILAGSRNRKGRPHVYRKITYKLRNRAITMQVPNCIPCRCEAKT